MGDGEEAERRLREAIESLAAQGDSPILAEAWGDLGELLGKSGRHAEARQCLEENMAVNTRLGHLGGIGVAEGLMAELDFAEGQWDQAESRLRKTLDIARRLDYRWREAWVLERLGTLHRARGRPQEGALLLEEARRLFQAIGSKKQ
jgi:tetratricopeptide (TPR) repeat protein